MTTHEGPIGASSRDQFIADVSSHVNSGISVIAVRTKEPHRALHELKELALATPYHDYKHWTMTQGWVTHDRDNPAYDGTPDECKSPVEALQKIHPASTEQEGFPDEGFFALVWPHYYIKDSKVPPAVQLLSQYAHLLPETGKRIFLIVPYEFTAPQELEDSISVIDLGLPTAQELKDTYIRNLDAMLRTVDDEGNAEEVDNATYGHLFEEEYMASIINAGLGMTIKEFEDALSRVCVDNGPGFSSLPSDQFSLGVMQIKTEVIKRSEVLEIMPLGTMADVGGLVNLKDWVTARKNCFTQEAADFGVDRPKGCALIGPPGTGKSLSAKAIAHELGLPLIKFDVSRVFTSLVGASEGKVRAALKMLDAMAPCVALLDEVDKAFDTNSSGGDSGVGQRILGSILTHMQDSDAPIFWAMAANRTARLPPEMLRKGRLDEVFSVSVPSEDERMEILSIHLQKRGWEPASVDALETAVAASAGYVPSELEAAVREAITMNYSQWVKDGRPDEIPTLTGSNIAAQLAEMKPLSEAFKERFENMQSWAENNARPANKRPILAKTKRRRPVSEGKGRRVNTAPVNPGALDG